MTEQEQIERLTKQLAETRRALLASEAFRDRYRKGKLALYSIGGAVQDAAWKHLPCSEGPLESFVHTHILLPQYGMLMDELHATAIDFRQAEAERDALRQQLDQARAEKGWQPTGDSLAASCMDCGRPYELFPLDLLFPRSQWCEILQQTRKNPSGPGHDGGLLCAQCMIARASKVPGATCVQAVIEINPHRNISSDSSRFQTLAHDVEPGAGVRRSSAQETP